MSENDIAEKTMPSTFWRHGLWVVLLLGLVNRVAMSVNGYVSTFDTGTPGLMAVHILQGERPLFFYGQHYMGAMESYVAAFLFSVLGISETVKTLSPILFSLGWIAATYALFSECLNRKAGFAASMVLAFCGWQTLWYNIGTYGGYPEAFMFGTLVLWLSVRLLKRRISGRELYLYVPWIGLLAGLGLWTNFICGAYLGLAGILLIIHKFKVVGIRNHTLPYVVAVIPFLIAITPIIEVMMTHGGSRVASFNFEDQFIKGNYHLMTSNLIPELFYWPFNFSDTIKNLLILLVLAGMAVTGMTFWRPQPGLSRVWMLIPLVFVAIFLLLYLPHSMASVRASRYLIPGYSIFLCVIFGYGLCCDIKIWRVIAAILLIYWTAYNAISSVHMMDVRKSNTVRMSTARQFMVDHCQALGLTQVNMVGGFIDGHKGQIYSFLSKGGVAFGSLYDERYQPTAQALEVPSPQALLCSRGKEHKVRRTLDDLGIGYTKKRMEMTSLVYELDVKPHHNELIPPEDMSILRLPERIPSPELLDDRVSTSVTGSYGSYDQGYGLLIDLKEARSVNQLWLQAPDWYQAGLPKNFLISTSLDGENFDTLREIKERLPVAYTQGTTAYLLGYYGILETRLPDVQARYLKILFRKGEHPRRPWTLSNVFVFHSQPAPQGTLDDDLATMETLLSSDRLDFLASDRWVSGSLHHRPGLAGHVLPRFNPKFRNTWYSRYLRPRKGNGLAVSRALADQTEKTLQAWMGAEADFERRDLNYYSVFLFNDSELQSPYGSAIKEQLYWSGHSLVSRDIDVEKDKDYQRW